MARKWGAEITHAMCNFDGFGALIGGVDVVGICAFVMFGWFHGARADGTLGTHLGTHKGCPYRGLRRVGADVW